MGRIHTGKGRFVGFAKLPHAFRSFVQAVQRKLTGKIPRLPWIPFSAAKRLNEIIQPDWVAWEIGAGFSTLWLADRVQSPTSIEASEDWWKLLQERIALEMILNTDLMHEWRGEVMANFSEVMDGSLDLLFIDGGPRALCFVKGTSKNQQYT